MLFQPYPTTPSPHTTILLCLNSTTSRSPKVLPEVHVKSESLVVFGRLVQEMPGCKKKGSSREESSRIEAELLSCDDDAGSSDAGDDSVDIAVSQAVTALAALDAEDMEIALDEVWSMASGLADLWVWVCVCV